MLSSCRVRHFLAPTPKNCPAHSPRPCHPLAHRDCFPCPAHHRHRNPHLPPALLLGRNRQLRSPSPLFTIPIPSSRDTVPTGYHYVLPDQNGWSRYLHFEAAWLLALHRPRLRHRWPVHPPLPAQPFSSARPAQLARLPRRLNKILSAAPRPIRRKAAPTTSCSAPHISWSSSSSSRSSSGPASPCRSPSSRNALCRHPARRPSVRAHPSFLRLQICWSSSSLSTSP